MRDGVTVAGSILLVWGVLGGGALAATRPALKAPLPAAFGVFVGCNRGRPGDRVLKYAEADAARLRRLLLRVGGLSPSGSTVLKCPGQKAIRRAVGRVRTFLAAHRRSHPSSSTTFLFYYSGHATRTAIHPGGRRIGFSRLVGLVSSVPATARLTIYDACHSGSAAQVGSLRPDGVVPRPGSGRRRRPAARLAPGSWSVFSSAGGEESHELDRLRSSIFTHHLVSALRGAADRNRDGRITLGEAFSYVATETVADARAAGRRRQHPLLQGRRRGSSRLTLSEYARAGALLRFPARLKGSYYVLDLRTKRLVGEVQPKPLGGARLGVRPGSYLVVSASRPWPRVMRAGLSPGSTTVVRDGWFTRLGLITGAGVQLDWLFPPKGEQLHRSPYKTPGRVALGGTVAGLATAAVLLAFSRQGRSTAGATGGPSSVGTPNGLRRAALVTAGGAGLSALAALVLHVLDRRWRAARPASYSVKAR